MLCVAVIFTEATVEGLTAHLNFVIYGGFESCSTKLSPKKQRGKSNAFRTGCVAASGR